MSNSENRSISFLAGKYLRNRGRGVIGKAHYLTLGGIILGVLALLCVSSVMNGFRGDIGRRISGTMSEIRVRNADGSKIDNPGEIVAKLEAKGLFAAPVIRSELIIKYRTVAVPTIAFGIDPLRHNKVSRILQPMTDDGSGIRQGIIAGSATPELFAADGIALAAGLAAQLNVYPGDVVQIISPLFSIPTAFGMIPRVKSYTVIAVFESAMPEYQQSYSYLDLQGAGFFANQAGSVDYIDVRTKDFNRAEQSARQLEKDLSGYTVDSWSRFDASLYSAIRFEKFIMFVIMLFMYVIASFNLTGNMLKAISQKKRELGLLKALGYGDRDLRQLFLRQSVVLSTLGIGIGVIIASLLLWLQATYGLVKLDAGDSIMSVLPVKVMWQDYILVIAVSYLITLISILLPLKRLRGIDAVELIRKAV